MTEGERIYKTLSEIEQFVIKTVDQGSSLNWDEIDKHSDEEITKHRENAENSIVLLEEVYTRLTNTNDISYVKVVDSIIFSLADAYAARHTLVTVLSVRSTLA
jgi:hypothetical protein